MSCSFNRVYNHIFVQPQICFPEEITWTTDASGLRWWLPQLLSMVCQLYTCVMEPLAKDSVALGDFESKLRLPVTHGLWTGRKGVCSWRTYSGNYQVSQEHLDTVFRLWKGKQAGCLRYTEQESNSWVIPAAGGVLHLYSCFWYDFDWSQGCRFWIGESFFISPFLLTRSITLQIATEANMQEGSMHLILLVN